MSILAEIFATEGATPGLASVQASPRDVVAAAGVLGWLSDPDSRWIPLAVEGCGDA